MTVHMLGVALLSLAHCALHVMLQNASPALSELRFAPVCADHVCTSFAVVTNVYMDMCSFVNSVLKSRFAALDIICPVLCIT